MKEFQVQVKRENLQKSAFCKNLHLSSGNHSDCFVSSANCLEVVLCMVNEQSTLALMFLIQFCAISPATVNFVADLIVKVSVAKRNFFCTCMHVWFHCCWTSARAQAAAIWNRFLAVRTIWKHVHPQFLCNFSVLCPVSRHKIPDLQVVSRVSVSMSFQASQSETAGSPKCHCEFASTLHSQSGRCTSLLFWDTCFVNTSLSTTRIRCPWFWFHPLNLKRFLWTSWTEEISHGFLEKKEVFWFRQTNNVIGVGCVTQEHCLSLADGPFTFTCHDAPPRPVGDAQMSVFDGN